KRPNALHEIQDTITSVSPRTVFVSMLRRPASSALFPYTTLFRSRRRQEDPRRGVPANGRLRAVPGGGALGRARVQGPLHPLDHEIGRATSELQSLRHLVCRLLHEKKTQKTQAKQDNLSNIFFSVQ